MDWNYDETCHSVTDVLADAGFEIEEDKRGICNLSYPYQKAGQEGVFLGAVAPYVRAGSHIIFEGEDGDRWGYSFDGSRMIECDVSLTLTPLPTYDPVALADAAKTVAGQSGVSEKSNMTIKL